MEKRVMDALVSIGGTNKQIGARLGIDASTVSVHLHNIQKKLDRLPNPENAKVGPDGIKPQKRDTKLKLALDYLSEKTHAANKIPVSLVED